MEEVGGDKESLSFERRAMSVALFSLSTLSTTLITDTAHYSESHVTPDTLNRLLPISLQVRFLNDCPVVVRDGGPLGSRFVST